MSEEWLTHAVLFLVRLVEAAGAIIIFSGAAVGFFRFVYAAIRRRPDQFEELRLQMGRTLALGLEFQLASDLLRTAIAPSFEEIGKLGAVAAIRTALNYFLAKEMDRERREVEKRP